MVYDALLKELIPKAVRFTELLAGSAIAELLPTEFKDTRARTPDLLARLRDGRLLHIEVQSSNDARMHWRMLEYFTLITELHGEPTQRVLYIGTGPLRMSADISLTALTFRCPVIDIRAFSAESLIEEGSDSDHLLALLGGGLNREAVRKILAGVSRLDADARADALKQVALLSDLRGAKALVDEEVVRMPVTLEPYEGSYLKQWMDESRAIGERRILRTLLERRFGLLPDSAITRLESATPDQLESWAVRILDAPTLDEFFTS